MAAVTTAILAPLKAGGPCADERLARLAALEEDDARDREDVVARRRGRVLVDVQLRELDAARVLLGELLHDRMDSSARSAPRGPEVDDDRRRRAEDVLLERRVGDVLHGVIVVRHVALRAGAPAPSRSP